jgi:iron complex outermembrane receptor protein
MQHRKSKYARGPFYISVLLPTTALGISLAAPAIAQEAGSRTVPERSAMLEEVIVTARRKEESIQDVPISISVFNQKQLEERNVVTASDLANYTPSLSSNERFGSDNSSFAIRGFTQELRTTASVGVYFADVVAPRGGGNITGGDGAGPGAFFDLQNVQVLKGPQGTLFGRNTTGGAVLLVPQKPTHNLEGYVEASAGNLDLKRAQGVINVPFGERARARFGVDYQKRDGYLRNVSGIGPDRLGDLEYISGRASFVFDLTDSLENYSILTYTHSKNRGSIQKLIACNPAGGLGAFCAAQLATQDRDFYALESTTPDPFSRLQQWQGINTTTWTANDDLTVKNILSYAKLESTLRTAIFGSNWFVPAAVPGVGGLPFNFANSDQVPGDPTNSQASFVEELQLQGRALDNDLVWQAGLYYERSKPDGFTGSQSQNQVHCTDRPGADPTTFNCQDVLRQLAFVASRGLRDPGPVGSVQRQLGEVDYKNKAVYAQTTYDITQKFKVTGGLRYTADDTQGTSQMIAYRGFPGTTSGAPTITACINPTATLPECIIYLRQKSNAPTWLIDFDYLPADGMLLYAKYARGYRQGSVNLFGAAGFNTDRPEHVDAYEVGSKTTFGGPLPGTLNIAAFYNELRDQQLQAGFRSSVAAVAPTTGIVNAGQSTIEGLEVETSLSPFRGFSLDVAYTYLDTKLKALQTVTAPPGSVFDVITFTADVGGPLPQSPKHKASATATYRLPLPQANGELSLGATYVYTAKQNTAAPSASPYATLDAFSLLNLNLNWRNIANTRVDASVFATNVTNEKYMVFVAGLYGAGFEAADLGQPRMWGVRLRYSFGE